MDARAAQTGRMAKKLKKQKKGTTTNATQKRRAPRSETPQPRPREGTNLNVWLPDHLMEAWEFLRQLHRRTHKAEAEVMMELFLSQPENRDALQAAGLWPLRSSN